MKVSRRMRSEPPSSLGRILQMGFPELACRSRQQAFKWVERVRSVADINRVRNYRRTFHPWRNPNSESFERFLHQPVDRFFQGPSDRQVPAALALQTPSYCKELVATANEICLGRFDLLGYRGLDFGDPLSWNFDPISGCRAPILHWSRLDPLNYATVGDSKVIWELNRHQWMVHLGQAYWLTHEERYADIIVRYLQSWLNANPPGRGINWTSSLEVSFRLIAWCWALVLIRDSGALAPSLFAEVMESVQAHATHIERYLSYYFSPNTHLTGEALGLLYASIVFPWLRRAERWRALATRILVQEIDRQVLPDGVYYERSTCYQRYTVDIYLHFLILAARAGVDIPSVVSERVQAMLDFLVTVSLPDGSMPSIGDADGGALLPLSKIKPDDFQ